MGSFVEFESIALYLQHPMVLVGFVLFLFFGLHRVLIRSRIIPPLSQQSGSRVVQTLLRYGFVVAVLVIVFGFALEFRTHRDSSDLEERIDALTTEVRELLGYAGEGPAAAPFQLSIMRGHDLERAEHLIEEANRILDQAGAGTSSDDYYRLGNIFVMLGDMDRAAASFLAATDADPDMGDAYLGLGLVYQLQANDMIRNQNYGLARDALEKAEGYVQIALNYDAGDPDVHVQLGYVHKDRAQLLSGPSSTPNNAEIESSLSKATTHFRMALGVDENNPSAHNGLASVYIVQAKYDEAIEEATIATKLAPSYLFAYFDLASAYYGKGLTLAYEGNIRSSEFCDSLLGFQDALVNIGRLLEEDSRSGQLSPAAIQNLDHYAGWFAQSGSVQQCDPPG